MHYHNSILAVGYEARKFGVSRMLRGDEAKKKCPDIIIFNVPEKRGKADLTKYRMAGAEVGSINYTMKLVEIVLEGWKKCPL